MNSEESKKENGDYIDLIDNFWEDHKNSLSSKFSILLGVVGGIGSVLVGMKMFVPASIVLGVCNVGIFFSGIAIERIGNDNNKKTSDIESLHKEKREIIRRFTMVNQSEPISITPMDSEDTVEPINFELMHHNNVLQDSMNTFAFPKK